MFVCTAKGICEWFKEHNDLVNYKCCGKMSPSLVVTMRAANMLIFL